MAAAWRHCCRQLSGGNNNDDDPNGVVGGVAAMASRSDTQDGDEANKSTELLLAVTTSESAPTGHNDRGVACTDPPNEDPSEPPAADAAPTAFLAAGAR